MLALADAKIRFSDAIEAVGITAKTLRGWMAHPGFSLFSETLPHGWTAFTGADLALLAIMRPLVTHGVGIEAAASIARAVLLARLGPLVRMNSMPAHVLESVMLAHRLVVWREAEEWAFTIIHEDDAEPDEPVFVSIDLAAVVAATINRALENEGAS